MPVKGKKAEVRREPAYSALWVDPPLARFQAVTLAKLSQLGKAAFGYNVLQSLTRESGTWMDPSLVYGTLRKTSKLQPPYIQENGTLPSPAGGPPVKVYVLKEAGLEALMVRIEVGSGCEDQTQPRERTMTIDRMTLKALVEKGSDDDLLREMMSAS